MKFLDWLKGVFDKMLGKDSIQTALSLTPMVSNTMRDSIELWENMYTNHSPWLTENIHSLGIASLIASEKARMATLEMEVKITGDNERADVMRDSYKRLSKSLREQLEYGMALGSFVIKPYVVKGPNDKYKIKFTFTKADNFYPLSFSADGELTSAAFIDRIITKDKVYSKVEIQAIAGNTVMIQNKAFMNHYNSNTSYRNLSSLGSEIALSTVLEWSELEPEVTIPNVDTLFFGYFKNPEANNVDLESPLGVSGFSRAVSLIKEADEQYSNLLWEFEGGQLAIDVDRTALNPMRDSLGREKQILPKLQDRLYRRNLDLGTDDMYNIFAPQLRDSSILNGLNNILMHIEDACCLARGTISEVNVTEARTATELKILKQRAFASNADVQKALEHTLEQVFEIIDIYCDLYSIAPSGEYEIAYKWDDSILVDKDSERQSDLLDINAGLMSKVEYRMKWFGETEKQAEESMQKILDEVQSKLEMQQEAMIGQSVDGKIDSTTKQSELDKKTRAQESLETTTKSEE